ncbi:MAG: methionyl-tRNA formyltransferase [Bdellovibrio sp.]|nr:methionyl-tRNA formyltransferase [Bdellovibrio sp.]
MNRVVFMGTPDAAVPVLDIIQKSGKYQIVGVYTQPDKPVGRGLEVKVSPVKAKALEFGLPVFQPEKMTLPGEFEKLSALQPDFLVVVAYGQILKRNVLDLPRFGCINVHFSLLPRWRGAAPFQWAILAGDQETGVSTMVMAQKLDAGPVLLQEKVTIEPHETTKSLHDRLAVLGAKMILPTLEGLERNTLVKTIQDESRVTLAPRLTKEMELLDSSQPAEVLDRRVRALNPWPGTSVRVGGQRLKIKAALARRDIAGTPGLIFEKAGMLLLGTTEGSLELIRLQWDGKKEVDVAEFLNGLRGRGQVLPLKLV